MNTPAKAKPMPRTRSLTVADVRALGDRLVAGSLHDRELKKLRPEDFRAAGHLLWIFTRDMNSAERIELPEPE